MTTTIDRRTAGIRRELAPARLDRRVERSAPNANDSICGKLEFAGQNGNTYTYREVGAGCIWVYLTDCAGNIDAGMQHMCVPGNTLNVDGCHAFGCNC